MIKSKKSRWIAVAVLVLLCLLAAYIFKPMTMNDLKKEPNFVGTVTEVYENSILVSIDPEQEASKS